MSKQDRAALALGILLVMAAFVYASHIWGIWEAVNLAIRFCLLLFYIKLVTYLFSKRSLVLKVIAIFLFPFVILTLFMPFSLRRRVKSI